MYVCGLEIWTPYVDKMNVQCDLTETTKIRTHTLKSVQSWAVKKGFCIRYVKKM